MQIFVEGVIELKNWNKGLDKRFKKMNDCANLKSCDKCHHFENCKNGTPLEKRD